MINTKKPILFFFFLTLVSVTEMTVGISSIWGAKVRRITNDGTSDFILGVDISAFDELDSTGVIFKKNKIRQDLLSILKECGTNLIRLRLWDVPDNDYCSLRRTILQAKRLKALGFRFMLDIHYSESWADPEKQFTPTTWRDVTDFSSCKNHAARYTKEVLAAFNDAGVPPYIVQIGNEITNGFLWPYGKMTKENRHDFFSILKSSCEAAKATSPKTLIMLHIDRGGDKVGALWWFNEARSFNIDYDLIGLSYYSYFHGANLDAVRDNIGALKMTFQKPVIIVETGYPWTLDPKLTEGFFCGPGKEIISQFPATPKGQKDYLKELCRLVRFAGGSGVVYWEADSVSYSNKKSGLENLSWFDFNNNYLGTGDAYLEFSRE